MASYDLGADDGHFSARFDDLLGEMRAGFQDIRRELRAVHARVDALLLAMVIGLLGVMPRSP